MAISKNQKQHLIEEYKALLDAAHHVFLIKQSGLDVNTSSVLRKQLTAAHAKMIVVRKRLLLRSAASSSCEEVELSDMDGSVVAVFVSEENSPALSIVFKMMKRFKQEELSASLQFLGGWYDKQWKSGDYVSELATMPSREELLGKFLYLLNSPLQRFAFLADQIAQKKGE